MTNEDVKLVIETLCYAMGDSDRHYQVTVDGSGIMIEYVASEITDRSSTPADEQRDSEFEIGHYYITEGLDFRVLVDNVVSAIKEIESVGIEYKRF